MPIVNNGSINLAAIGVPNAIVNIIPPNPLLNGVPTNVIGAVGIANWGAVNSPVPIGSMQQQVAVFGAPMNAPYDLGTQVYAAYLQGANNFLCVRVTDGTDVPAYAAVNDNVGVASVVLSGLYTGTLGNSLKASVTVGSNSTVANPTYKLSVWFNNGIPETFDNIGGASNAVVWTNMVNAVNLGQGPARGPSQLVRAGIPGTPASVTVNSPGVYASLPSISATIGSGATFTVHMQAVTATVAGGGTGYAVGDTITLSGGTGTEPILTVLAVAAGVITDVSITTPGSLTVLASNPVSQGSTSGSGTSATFNLQYGLASVAVSGGTGYTQNSQLVITGGGVVIPALTTLTVTPGSPSNPPSTISTYTFANGTSGNSGVSDAQIIGNDFSMPRSGMYALRNTQASVAVLADQTNSSYWGAQATFGEEEGIYMIGVMANDDMNITAAVSLKQNVGVNNYEFKLMLGDWVQIFDPFNNVNRFISPAGFVAGILATNLPDNSSLNKPMNGIICTQKTFYNQVYSQADLQALQTGGIDVITSPIPASNTQYGVRLGINTSGNITTIGDNYTRMTNFIAATINQGIGQFIGQPQTVDLQNQARATLQGFFQNLQNIGLIGTLDGSPAYQVILDSSNNLPQQVALGYMQANVQVVYWSIIFQFIVNLQAGQSVQIQALPPQLV
ncbi:MAG: hypothetical protein KGJ07_00025 [Patescibacteria group bacterium]|nr:hypothetical protein [Patescibacteria group bacterium]